MSDDTTLAKALEPVRAALSAAARRDAERAQQQARLTQAEILAAASAQADEVRRQARKRGAAEASATLRAEQARAGRHARAEILRARRDGYEALQVAARAAVETLRDDPAYPRARQRMVDLVRELLGPRADVVEGTGGGVVGQVPGRRVDLSLAGFAARAVDAEAAELAGIDLEPP